MEIKAIETVYKGYRFRSRLEAKWAFYFDVLGVEWLYEAEGFDLGPLGYYLPDFLFPGWGCWGEVKPSAFTEDEYNKCAALAPKCLLLEGMPDHKLYYLTGHTGGAVYDDELDDSISLEDSYQFYLSGENYWRIHLPSSAIKKRLWYSFGEDISSYYPNPAVGYAKQARWEHGEQPELVKVNWA